MIVRRIGAFFFDIWLLITVFFLAEHTVAVLLLIYSVEHPINDINKDGTVYMALMIPVAFGLLESGTLFNNTPGKKLFGVHLSFSPSNRAVRVMKSIARSFFFFAFPFYVGGLMLFEIYFLKNYYLITLVTMIHLLTPMSLLLSKGRIGLHDILFGCCMQKSSSPQPLIIKKSWIVRTFFLSLSASIMLYIICLVLVDYRHKVVNIVVSGLENTFGTIRENLDNIVNGKHAQIGEIDLPYTHGLEQERNLNVGKDADLAAFIGISNDHVYDISRVNVTIHYLNNGDRYIPDKAKILIFLYGPSFHNLSKKNEIALQVLMNTYKMMPKSIKKLNLTFVRSFHFDMVIVGYSEILVFDKDKESHEFKLLHCAAEPYHKLRFNIMNKLSL